MREYAARGLPVVYGHDDPDYEGLTKLDMALKMRAMAIPEMSEIINFAHRVCNQQVSVNIRDYASKTMDMSVKMRQLVDTIKLN
jgi:hypothetical protein